MFQTDLFTFSSKLAASQLACHCHHFFLIVQIKTLVSSCMLASPSFFILNQSPRMLFFLHCIFQIYPFPSVSTLGPAFFTLSGDVASSLIFLLQTAPTGSPGAPRPPCKQLPAQLSEMLLLACSLIKNLQRPLTAYTTKSQPVCLSFRSLHYPPPLCPLHFISHSFPQWSLFYDWSPHWLWEASRSSCFHAVCKLFPCPK